MSRWQRYAPLSGVLAVALWIVGIIVVNHNSPADHATDQEILDYYKANKNWVLLGGWLFMLGCLAFIWFAAMLRVAAARRPKAATAARRRRRLRRRRRAAIFGMIDPGARHRARRSTRTTSARRRRGRCTAHATRSSSAPSWQRSCFFLGAAVLAFRTGVLPKWWAALMVLVAVVLVIGPIGWAGARSSACRSGRSARA